MAAKTFIKKSKKLATEVPYLFATAPCRGDKEHLFYSFSKDWDTNIHAYRKRLSKAREICSTCPIARTCEQEARSLPRSTQFGIWAGRDLALEPYETTIQKRYRDKHRFTS